MRLKVQVFSIGLGRELFGITDGHGTRWKVSVIPLGGYVKFLGDENAASLPDRSVMSAGECKSSFFCKSVGERAAVFAAGPIASFLLAMLIFAAMALVYTKQETAHSLSMVDVHSIDPVAAVRLGQEQTWAIIDETFSHLARWIIGRESSNQIGGPVGIALMSGQAAKLGFDVLMRWTATISVSVVCSTFYPSRCSTAATFRSMRLKPFGGVRSPTALRRSPSGSALRWWSC